MTMQHQNRHLAAILFTDIVGYTGLMQQDEVEAVAAVKHYGEVLRKTVATHEGRILNDYGDGNLCSFASATQAVGCAVAIQEQLQNDPRVPLRIGLHVGEIFFEGEKILGDGVNVASRIQSLGEANTILFSKEIYDKIRNRPEFKAVSLGLFEFKHVDDPVEVFALANKGLKIPRKEEMKGKLKESNKKSGKFLWLSLAAFLIVFAVGFFLYKQRTVGAAFTGEDKSIAVLPFDNTDTDRNEDYISDGITQDIINNLSKISSLQKVIAWFSVKNMKKTGKSPKEIADELGVEAILTGTIQRVAGNIHIVAELLDVNTSKRIWGEDYTYIGIDILTIQSTVALKIVNALDAKLTPRERINISTHYTENVEAYKYYIRGREFWNARGKENFDSAEANYQRAIKLDSNYALAYAGIADCYTFNHKGMPQIAAMGIAKAYAQQALALDSNLSEGMTTLGFIKFNFDYDWTGAEKNLARAVELEPNNPFAHMYYGIVKQYTGDTEKGLREAEKAVALDPLGFGTNWVLGRNYYFARKYDKALKQFENTGPLATKNNAFTVFWSEGLVYFAKNMPQQALDQFGKIPDDFKDYIDNVAVMKSYALALSGDKKKATLALAKAISENPQASVYRIAQVYAALGDKIAAMRWLQEGYLVRDLHMFCISVDPGFDLLRNEPEFKALLKSMGFT